MVGFLSLDLSNTRAGSFFVGGSCPLPAVGCYRIYIKQHFWLLSTKGHWHPLPAVTSSVPPDIAKCSQDPSQGSLEKTETWSARQNWVAFVLGWWDVGELFSLARSVLLNAESTEYVQ